MVVVTVAWIEEVWVGRIHPPGIDAIVEELLQVIPVDLTSHRTVCVIHPHA